MRMSDIMSHLGLAVFPIIGMLLFLAAFAGAMWRVLGSRRAAAFREAAHLPLADDARPQEARP